MKEKLINSKILTYALSDIDFILLMICSVNLLSAFVTLEGKHSESFALTKSASCFSKAKLR